LTDTSLIIVGVAVMLALAAGIVSFVFIYQRRIINHQLQLKEFNRKKQVDLMQASIRSEEEERMRIAAELHDDVGATLASVRLMLGQAERRQDISMIAEAKSLLDESIQRVRNISHQLQPGTLQYLGLQKSLQSLAEMLSRTGHMKVSFVAGENWQALAPATELALYRIVQELLNNITKHAAAQTVELRTEVNVGAATIRLSHNGEGLTDQSYHELLYKKGAIGLKNIENRIKSIGAAISFPKPNDGLYTVVLSVPTTKESN
jgi:two-component system, NarL family, sensor kinase